MPISGHANSDVSYARRQVYVNSELQFVTRMVVVVQMGETPGVGGTKGARNFPRKT